MCARYTATPKAFKMTMRFRAQQAAKLRGERYNIAPSQDAPVVFLDEGGTRRLEEFRWGLVPAWAKDLKIGQKLFNARGESVHEKPAFRQAFAKRRCLVPADGFYEWPEKGKFPRRIHKKTDDLFSFAGVWEAWKNPEGQEVRSYTLITCAPNAFMETVHDRMPVILTEEQEERWIDPHAKTEDLIPILTPREWTDMEVYTVSKLVNSPKNDILETIEPLAVAL